MSTKLGKISCVRYSGGVGRPPLGKEPYTSTMAPDVRKKLDAYAKRLGKTRGEVIEELVRRHLGLPTVDTLEPAPKPRRLRT